MATDTANGSTDDASSPADPAKGPKGGAMRSSAIMAVGTMVSRITGFVRTIVLAAALGTQLLGDAYNTANTIPFIINDLLIQGLMASVIIPFLVKRRKNDTDGGKATEDRLFTAAVLLLFAVSVAAIAIAQWLLGLYAGGFTDQQMQISVYLARFLLAQIFFVGLSGLISAMLNTRDKFGAPVWAPVLNNAVIIAVGAAFIWIAAPGRTPENISQGELTLLGAGTACGMVAQTIALVVSLWRTGFRWRPRLDLRGSGLGEALHTAGWMFLYTCTTQVGFLITTNIATRAGSQSVEQGFGVGAGLTAYNYAYQLFQLPYAIIAVSLITVLLPRMSSHAHDGLWHEVRDGFSRTLRVSALFLVPLALAMAVYAVQLSVLVFARGSTSVEDARNIGIVLAVMSLGLVPFTIFQLMLRVFYAMGDTRTPAMISIANVTVHGILAVGSFLLLPPNHVVVGVAAGFMLSFVSGLIIAGTILSARLGGLDGKRIIGALIKLHLASVPSVAAAIGVLWLFERWFGPGLATNLGAPAAGCVLGAVLFVVSAKLMRVRELQGAVEMVRSRAKR